MDPVLKALQRIINFTHRGGKIPSVSILTHEEASPALMLVGSKIVEFVREAEARRACPDNGVHHWSIYARSCHQLIPCNAFIDSEEIAHVGADLLGSIVENVQRGGGDPSIPDEWIGKRIFFLKTRIVEDDMEFMLCLDCTGSGGGAHGHCRPRASMRRVERVGIDPADHFLVYPRLHAPT